MTTQFHKARPVDSFANLRGRVERFFKARVARPQARVTQSLSLWVDDPPEQSIEFPSENVTAFLNFLVDALPQGAVFLFGGILRDLALFGRRGFNSDIDLVVEGDWSHCVAYLQSIGAKRNKFDGFRIDVGGWPIDVWNAEDTWAIRQGYVKYRGIASLTDTTILNWDAILMDWRAGTFIARDHYLEDIETRTLDVVLTENPNPIGMACRVFRHFCAKDARKVTLAAAAYLANVTATFTFQEIRKEEVRSYGSSLIDASVYKLFEKVRLADGGQVGTRFRIASEALRKELQLF